jgi:hypothetical protein
VLVVDYFLSSATRDRAHCEKTESRDLDGAYEKKDSSNPSSNASTSWLLLVVVIDVGG